MKIKITNIKDSQEMFRLDGVVYRIPEEGYITSKESEVNSWLRMNGKHGIKVVEIIEKEIVADSELPFVPDIPVPPPTAPPLDVHSDTVVNEFAGKTIEELQAVCKELGHKAPHTIKNVETAIAFIKKARVGNG